MSPKSLIDDLEKRYKLLIGAQAEIDNLSVCFDAIILHKDKLVLKYHPILFVYKEHVSKQDKLLLAFGGLILSKILNKHVLCGRVIRGTAFTSTRVSFDKLIPAVKNILLEIIRIFNGKSIPKIQLNAHCKVCTFKNYCQKIAVIKDDLSLLKGLSQKEITKLNKKGIFNITQLSYTFKPRRQKKKKQKSVLIFNPSLQALAIRENKIYIIKKPDLPSKLPVIYLDIEGIPDLKLYYLIGLHIDYGDFQDDYSFWAKVNNGRSPGVTRL